MHNSFSFLTTARVSGSDAGPTFHYGAPAVDDPEGADFSARTPTVYNTQREKARPRERGDLVFHSNSMSKVGSLWV
ncbi:hypothetical protein Pfo_023453 [Paulownia fortunei]|nr:hypothetical protein Pfo_023453 [Paulownia fortunei]